MSHAEQPSFTPNVRIENPRVRKVIGNIFGWVSVAITAVGIVDAYIVQIDLAFLLTPAAGIVGGLFGLYQLLITSANVPTV